MRLKGINPIEKHVEKFVLVVFGIALLGLLVFQFLGEPNAVEIGGQTYAPGAAREQIRAKALQKKGQLESIEAAPELAGDLPDYVGPFQKKLAGSDSPVLEIASIGESAIIRPGGDGDFSPEQGTRNSEKQLHIATPPAPAGPLAMPFEGTVAPEVAFVIADQIPQLADQPYDLRGISIQTSFDASEFKASLNSPPEDRNRIPLDWLRTIQVLDVEYARERLVDGEWIEDGIVPAVPGRESLRATIANPDFRPVQLVDLLKDERANRIDVRSPAVYKMISGLPWVAPVDFGKVRRTLPDSAQVARIVSSLKSKDAEIERLAVRRDDLADPEGRNRSQAQRIERELEKLNAQREAIVGELADLGVDEQGDSINEERDDLITAPPARETASNLLDEMGQITLWTHDVTAEKGNTFRYRARVVLTNPLFGRESRLQPEQKPEAQDLVVKTDWSAWSVPITLYPDVQYFVLGASPQQESNGLAQLASARVMACRFFYGYWRIAETRIEVGSVISAMVDLPELWKWEIAEGTDGPTLGSRTPIPSEIMISSDGFLLGVSEAVQDTSIPSLGELVVLSEAGSDVPVTRTPQIDRTSSELAAIRFSAQKGRGIAADSPETTPEP